MRQLDGRDTLRVSRRSKWYVIVAFALISITTVIVIFSDGDTRAAAASIGVFAGNMAAGAIFVQKASTLPRRERRAWTLVGRGLMIAASGIVAVIAWGVVTGDIPTYGVTDLFFVTGYAFILVGIGTLPHTAGDGWERSRVALDGLIGAIAVGAMGWVFVIEPIVAGLDGAPLADRVFGTLYPLVDIGTVIVIVVVTMRRTALRFDGRMLLLSGAVILQAIGDVSLLIGGHSESLDTAEPLFLVYLGAAALFLSTSLVVDRVPRAREYADRRAPLWSMLTPYFAASVMVVALLYRLWDGTVDQSDRVLLVATILVVVLVIARQAISIWETRVIVERQRSDLVSSVSHELRTPLTAMVGFLAVLQDDARLTAIERREMIDVVAEQSAYLGRVVEDMLALAHGDPDRMELNVSEHNVAALIESSLRSASIDRKGVAVEVQPGLEAVIDGSRLQQVLVNLLTNASWYGGKECVVVAFSRTGGLVIEVHDSGSGVPKKYELTIWERFERGENRYNANVPGSGIGLAMVKNIAESHGGTAGYRRSDRLGGACFFVDLPGRVGKQRPIAIVSSSTMAIG
jgi:signal transduction histidine kinase